MGTVRFASVRIAAGFVAMLMLAAPALGVEPSALTSTLVVPVDGVDKTLSLEEAMAAPNLPSVSFALIDGDRVAFAEAYGASTTSETIYQAASLSKFVAAVGAMRLLERNAPHPHDDVNTHPA